MPTAKQSWLKKYDTYYAQTEYNKKHYGKRIKQLKHMLEDEKFLEFLSSSGHKEDILEYLAKSNHFDMYIAYSEQGEPYIHDHDFGLINHMKKMLRVLQSEHYIANSSSRPQAKRYVEMYLWYDKLPEEELPF
jgi:ribosomal protein S8